MSHTRIAIDGLLHTIFGGEAHILAAPLADWMIASPRFVAFVETYRDKIRKKIRGMRDAEGLRDLQLELETAYLLLQARPLTVAYEPYGTGKARGPDFAVTYTTSLTFNVEVTRMRISSRERSKEWLGDPTDGATDASLEAQHEAARLADIVCGKLGQMVAGMINVLVVVAESNAALELDVGGAMLRLRQRAERKDPSLFARNGFQDASDFFTHYERLSGVLVRGASERAPRMRPILWENNRASHSIPARIRTILESH